MSPADHRQPNPGYETSDAQIRPLVIFGIGLSLLCLVSTLVCLELADRWTAEVDARSRPNPMADYRATPAPPLLQATTRVELDEHRAAEDELLDGYGWIDSENGVVHIPVAMAMQLLLEQGLPARDAEGGR